MIVVTAAEMQAMDRKTIDEIGIPGRVLMENAGRGAARCFMEMIYAHGSGRVAVVAGRGNNGGDGFVIARCLAQQGIAVVVYLLASSDRVKGDAAANLRLLHACNIAVKEIPDASAFVAHEAAMRHCRYWVDAIFGTGLNSEVRGYFRDIIGFINDRRRPVLAVDVPSGLNSDTGQSCGACIQATATVTFGHPKIGHLVQPGAGFCGRVVRVDIGIPPHITQMVAPRQRLITGALVKDWLPLREADSHKGRTGHLLVVAGSPGKTGAAAMTAKAALRVGAGLVTLAVPHTLNTILEGQLVEVMTWPLADSGRGEATPEAFEAILRAAADKRCVALGPGMGTAPETRALVHRMVREIDQPLVIDADGLNNLVGHLDLISARAAPVLLTPHPGEMARLMECSVAEIQKDRVGAVRRLASRCGAHVVLKGSRTLVGDPEGRVWINPTGNAGMAAGGMGDVLTGTLAGLITQAAPPAAAAVAGVYLHGLAGDLLAETAQRGYLATEVMDALPRAIQRVQEDPPPVPVATPWF